MVGFVWRGWGVERLVVFEEGGKNVNVGGDDG